MSYKEIRELKGSYRDKLQDATRHWYFESWLSHLDKSRWIDDAEPSIQLDGKNSLWTFHLQNGIALVIIGINLWSYVHTVGITKGIPDIQKHLKGLWRLQNPIDVLDLTKGVYVLRMVSHDDFLLLLAGGPRFLFDHYLAIQQWRPKFLPNQNIVASMAIWV